MSELKVMGLVDRACMVFFLSIKLKNREINIEKQRKVKKNEINIFFSDRIHLYPQDDHLPLNL